MTNGTCAYHAGYQTLPINTLSFCNTLCSSTVTMVEKTRLNVRLYVHFLSLHSCYRAS